jgi:hypothetical protein
MKDGIFQKADVIREFKRVLPFELSINHERFITAFEKKANLSNLSTV